MTGIYMFSISLYRYMRKNLKHVIMVFVEI